MGLSIGELIDGKYEIKRLLGEGGMGAVYEGENTLIHRKVAIKVLHAGVASNEEAVTRFEREAQAAGRIGSDHIVEVLDLGTLDSGDRYMVMEFLRGESLSDRIANRGRLSAPEICDVALQLLDGLSAAHEANIIHRDLKPDNVFLLSHGKGRPDFVKILDFGISKFSTLGKDFSMTRTGSVMGTPYYMAPEQARGAKGLDARLDIYAAGVILYQAATGTVPFDGDTFNELLIKIVTEETPPVSVAAPDLDPGLAAIIDKARQRDPNQRFQSSREFRDAIQSWLAVSGGKPLPAGQLTAKLFGPGPVPASAATPVAAFGGTVPLAQAPAGAFAATGVTPQQGPGLGGTAGLPAPAPPQLGANTNQAWANTGYAGIPAPISKKRWGAIGGGVAALLATVLAIGLKLGSDASTNATRAAAASEAADQKDAARILAEQKLEAERARSHEIALEAERAKAEVERVKVSVLTEKQEAERLERERQAEREAAALAAKATVQARPRAPAPRKPPAPSTSSSSGRKIRTSL
jgi:hypothetical protein